MMMINNHSLLQTKVKRNPKKKNQNKKKFKT